MGRPEEADNRSPKINLGMLINHVKILESFTFFILIHIQFCQLNR